MLNPAEINWKQILAEILRGSVRTLSRAISYIENRTNGYGQLLQSLPSPESRVIGITGPPGAGKSTLVDRLIGELAMHGKKVAVLCVDPSSPFHHGALLGDRIRMSGWYNNPHVFIRSLATRGTLGGLPPMVIGITDLVKAAGFDYIFIETVGVGQNEIEIAGFAEVTVVVLVPESGDEIQVMKAGLMEAADIFAVNKGDRPGADQFIYDLQSMIHRSALKDKKEKPVIKTIANSGEGIKELLMSVEDFLKELPSAQRTDALLTEKAYHLIQQVRMSDVDKSVLSERIREERSKTNFNLYQFVEGYRYLT